MMSLGCLFQSEMKTSSLRGTFEVHLGVVNSESDLGSAI